MRLSLVSFRPRLADPAHNLDQMTDAIAAARGDIVVFPEMALTGYLVKDRIHRLAEPMMGPSAARLAEVAEAHDRWVLYGYPRRDEERQGLVYNAANLIGPDGGVQVYDKRFPATFGPFEDGLYVTPGRDPGLLETPWGTIGLSICYDLFFPELHKALALQGADLLLNISASPTTSRRFFEALLPARAIENTLPMAYTNFCGLQDDLMFWGGAQLWGARGTLKDRAPYHEATTLEVEVDHEETRAARPLRPTLRDTRAEPLDELRDAY